MRANRPRRLKSGKEYDKLFPKPSFQQRTIRDKIDAVETVKDIEKIVLHTLGQTKHIAKVLKGKTVAETCENIWYFIYEHIQYARDTPGYEELHSPARIWAKRKHGVDCDDYTILISSILMNLGITHRLRMTKYRRDWQHIYVVVPHKSHPDGYFTIDPVVDEFDYEVGFSGKKDTMMKPKIQSSLGGNLNSNLGGISRRNPRQKGKSETEIFLDRISKMSFDMDINL